MGVRRENAFCQMVFYFANTGIENEPRHTTKQKHNIQIQSQAEAADLRAEVIIGQPAETHAHEANVVRTVLRPCQANGFRPGRVPKMRTDARMRTAARRTKLSPLGVKAALLCGDGISNWQACV